MRRFGFQHFALIENAVQDAGLRALDHWRNDAPEVNLEGWLLRVAHNRVVDALRRERRFVSLEKQHIGASQPPTTEMDDELRLVFLCCHPELTRASRIALTLRVAFGFATEQIARGFLSDSRTIAQRIVRAKQRLKGVRGSIRHPG